MNVMIIIVISSMIVLTIGTVIIYKTVTGDRRERNRYQNQSKGVIVKNGVDVKKQLPGDEKGEYFTGNLEKKGTYYVNPSVTAWRVVFDNLNTGERVYMDFVRQMWIGRTDSKEGGRARLRLSGDSKISRNHCTIYEGNGKLCLQDLRSSNHTYLNGAAVAEPVYLQNGDVIRVGDTQLRVQYSTVMGWQNPSGKI